MKDLDNLSAGKKNGINENAKYDYLNSLSTPELYVILQQESFLCDDESFNHELVMRVADILEEREPAFDELDVSASLERFKSEVIPELERGGSNIDTADGHLYPDMENLPNTKTGKRRAVGRLSAALAAAILTTILAGTFAASAMGLDVWDYIISWGKETLRIGTGSKTSNAPGSEPNNKETSGLAEPGVYDTFEEAVQALDINILVPDKIPECFILTRVETTDTPLHKGISALYQNKEEVLAYTADIYSSGNVSAVFEMDEGSNEEVMINGVKHYFMSNAGQTSAVWTTGGCIYSIGGNVTKDELIGILESMYEGEW